MRSISTSALVFCVAPLIILAKRTDDGFKGESGVESEVESEEEDDLPPFPIELLSGVVKRSPVPVLLGTGSFGGTWLVTDAESGREEIMKLFFLTGAKDRFMTHGDLRRSFRAHRRVKQARKECQVVQKLHDQAPVAGAERLLRCFGHNLDVGTTANDDMPLYLLLSYNGQGALDEYLQRPQFHSFMTLEKLKSIFKQIVEGLDGMHSLKHPIIHHDLKTDNVILWTHFRENFEPHISARLIDFGGAVDTEKDSPCRSTAATPGTAPPELDSLGLRRNGKCLFLNYDPDYPAKFDIYALGAIFMEIFAGVEDSDLVMHVDKNYCRKIRLHCGVIGARARWMASRGGAGVYQMGAGGVFKAEKEQCRSELRFCNRKYIKQRDNIKVFQSPFFFYFLTSSEYLSHFPVAFQAILDGIAADPAGLEFVKLIQKCYSFHPKDRPSARELLEHAWLRDVETAAAAGGGVERAKGR